MNDASTVVRSIVSLLNSSQGQKLLGSELSVLLRQEHPQFRPSDYSCRNLREFIQRNSPEVLSVGRSGGDYVYSTRAVATSFPASTLETPSTTVTEKRNSSELAIESNVWKTYVSPNGPYRLFVNPQTADFHVVAPSDTTPGSPWQQIPPCPATMHLQIARDFVATLGDQEAQAELAGVLQQEVWWPQFAARTQNRNLGTQWFHIPQSAPF